MKGSMMIPFRRFHSTWSIGIIGAGQMGSGIAQVAATEAKCRNVLVYDESQAALDKCISSIKSRLEKNVEKKKMTREDMEEAMSRLRPIKKEEGYEAFASCQMVIEAVSEIPALKESIFKSLSEKTPETTILATNTSSFSITKLAASVTRNPSRVIGMHFMNPVPVMKLVEVITALQTDEENTLKPTLSLAKAMGKVTTLSKDVPGFIANRILMPYINEAIFVLEQGIASREDIDTTMKLGTNVPMGPLTLADFIGLDTCLSIMRILHRDFGDSKYRPCPLLVNYVNAGYLGKKTNRGFYEYN